MNDLISQILIPFLTALSGGLGGWLLKRRRLKREDEQLEGKNKAQEITNVDAAIATWQKVVDALEKQIGKLLEQRKEDARQIEELSKEVHALRKQVVLLQERLNSQADNEAKIQNYEHLLSAHGIAY